MTSNRAIYAAIAACVALSSVASRAVAQADRDSVKLHNDCRLAEQVLRTGEPAPLHEFAARVIGRCGPEAVPALVTAWAAPDTATLPLFVMSTRAIVSPDLANALAATLGNAKQSTHTRVAALLVLLTYGDSTVAPGFASFEGDTAVVRTSRYGHDPHNVPQVGRETLPSHFLRRLTAALSRIAAADPDGAMRLAARVALRNPPIR